MINMENIQEVINRGNEKVVRDIVYELEELIEQRKQRKQKKQKKPFCGKTTLDIIAEKIKNLEAIDITLRFNQDK